MEPKKRILFLGVMLFICIHSFDSFADERSEDETNEQNITSTVIDYHMTPASTVKNNGVYYPNGLNPYKTLKVPATIVKTGSFYFIVDTYHNQVIFSRNVYDPIEKWQVLDGQLNLPHGIDSDGTNYVVLDTDNNKVIIYNWLRGGFSKVQEFSEIGIRPHCIKYDPIDNVFYVWSSMTGDMYILQYDITTKKMCIKEVRHIFELEKHYVRSFYIEGEYIYFPSGTNGYLIKAKKNNLEVVERYTVRSELAGMASLTHIGDYYYFAVSTDLYGNHNTAKLIRTKDFQTLETGIYEVITDKYIDMEIPYYFSWFDGYYYITSHGTKDGIYSFQVDENDKMKIQKSK